jgi:hypothetical protein
MPMRRERTTPTKTVAAYCQQAKTKTQGRGVGAASSSVRKQSRAVAPTVSNQRKSRLAYPQQARSSNRSKKDEFRAPSGAAKVGWPAWISQKAAAKLTGLGLRTIERAIAAAKQGRAGADVLAFSRVGSRVLIHRDDLWRFVDRREGAK